MNASGKLICFKFPAFKIPATTVAQPTVRVWNNSRFRPQRTSANTIVKFRSWEQIYFTKKHLCTTKHISEPNIVGSFSKFSKPNKIPGHSRLTRGHWTDPRMRNPRNYSKFRKKYYGGAMRTETVHELQERQSRASLLACFLVLKWKNKPAKRIKVTKMKTVLRGKMRHLEIFHLAAHSTVYLVGTTALAVNCESS